MNNMKNTLKYFSGILGGILFSIPWLLVYVFFNLSSGYLDCLIVFGIVLGYKLVNKDIYNDKKTRIYLIVSSCLIALLNVFVLMPVITMIRNGSGVTLNLFKEIYTNKEFLSLIWIDAVLALLMVLPPSIFFSLDFKNKETDKSDIQTYIDELEKIFDKYNAKSKESAVDKKIIKSDISNLEFGKFKKLFYTDILKPSYIKSIKGKWYFEHKDKKNSKIGLALAMYTLIAITAIWNVIIPPIMKEDSKIIEYKVNNNITLKMPDCMKLDEESHTNNDIETYYYSYLSQNVNKSNIEVVEISYYPKYDYDFKYEEFKELLTDSLSEYDILLTKDKIINQNKILYFKLNNADETRIVNSYFVPLQNNRLLEIYIYVKRDGYSSLDEEETDKIIESINFKE